VNVGSYRKPIAGDLLKTNNVIPVCEIGSDGLKSGVVNIFAGQIILVLTIDAYNNFTLYYNNKKYLYKPNFGRGYGGFYMPFTLVS
jgi:restriction endonuclease S subunit